jgi:hypothetical protein
MHADSWILTVKLAFFVALGFVRFVSESRASTRRYRAVTISTTCRDLAAISKAQKTLCH